MLAAQKMDAGAPTPASKQSGEAPACSTRANVNAPRVGGNLSDAWDGRFLSVPRRYRRMLGKLFQRSYLELEDGKETRRRLTSVPAGELASSTSSSTTTAQRAVKWLIAHGVLELVSEAPRENGEHPRAQGVTKKGQRFGGRFTTGSPSGSQTGRAHVFAIKVIGEDELAARRPATRSMARAWGRELAAYSSAAREVFAWLLAHENYGTTNPEERGLSWPGTDGATRGGGQLCVRTGLSRSTVYRALRELQDGHHGDGGKITRVLRPGRKTKAWRIHPAPLDAFRPGIVGVSPTRGQVRMGPNPGQFETATPVNLRHEVVGSEGIDLKGGRPVAPAAQAEADRPAAEGHTSAAPTGAGDKPRPANDRIVIGATTPDGEKEQRNEGERATGAPSTPKLSPVFEVLFAFAKLAAPHVAPEAYARDLVRQRIIAAALSRATGLSSTGRFTPAMLIAAAKRAASHPFYSRRFRVDFLFGSSDRIEELLDVDVRQAHDRAIAEDAQQAERAAAAQTRARTPAAPMPLGKVLSLGSPRPRF